MKIKPYLLGALAALLIAGCAGSPIVDQQSNTKAGLPKEAKFDQSKYKVMSTLINKRAGTMSTLYANDIAMRAARSGTLRSAAGIDLTLVTWKQQANPYWYGNNIPGELLSVETLTSGKDPGSDSYTFFDGKKMAFDCNVPEKEQRKSFILGQKPSIMP